MNAQLKIAKYNSSAAYNITVTANDNNPNDQSKGPMSVIDGDLTTYWITNPENKVGGPKWLVFDFKRNVTIDRWITYHRQFLDTQNTRYNTRDFSLQKSENGVDWLDVDVVEGNELKEVDRLIEPATARYFRIYITKPVQPGYETATIKGDRTTARIAEADFYFKGTSLVNGKKYGNQQSFAYSASDTAGYYSGANFAFDSKEATGWRSDTQEDASQRYDKKMVPTNKWISLSSDSTFTFDQIEIKHIGARYQSRSLYNTYDYQIEVSEDNNNWTPIQAVEGNTDHANMFTFDTPIATKFLRVYITKPVHPSVETKHLEKDRTNAAITDINLFMDGVNVVNPPAAYDNTYLHEQDLLNAEVRSQMLFEQSLIHFKSWTADDKNLLITDVSLDSGAAEPVELSFELLSPSTMRNAKGADGDVIWLTRESTGTPSYVSKIATATKILEGEHRLEDGRLVLKLEPGQSGKIATFANSSSSYTSSPAHLKYKELSAVNNDAISQLNGLSVSDIDTLHTKHLEWWKNYWLRSFVNIDDEILQNYYYGALYAMGSGIRPTPDGAEQPNLPMAMHGLWQTNDTSVFMGKAYTNYNYEAPYYGMFSSNRGDLLEPYYEEAAIRVSRQQNATANAGYKGAQIPRSFPPNYNTLTKVAPKAPVGAKKLSSLPTDQKSNIMLYTQPLIWDWQYNRNEERLQKYIYPAILETVIFYMDFVVKGPEGKYWIYNSANNELNASSAYDINPALDLGYIRSHFAAFIEMSTYLNQNVDMIPAMQEILDNLSPFATNQNSPVAKQFLESVGFNNDKQLILSGYFSDNEDQRKASNKSWGSYIYEGNQPVALEAVVHPAENVSLASDPEMLTLARDTFEYFNPLNVHYRGAGYNGFPKSFTIAARIGFDPETLVNDLKVAIAQLWRNNLTAATSGHGIETMGTIEAINSMFLQNEANELRLFPSWTKQIDARFVDLKAKGAFLVTSEYNANQGEVQLLEITSEKGNRLNLVSPWAKGLTIKDKNGKTVAPLKAVTAHTNELIYSIPTEAGMTYEVTKGDADGLSGVDKGELVAAIANSQAAYGAAEEGNGAGKYPVGSKAVLKAAMDAAQVVVLDPAAALMQVETAIEALQLALESFQASVIDGNSNVELNVIANPVNGGAVTGGGVYGEGSTAVIQAQPNRGYAFTHWTVDGVEVSAEQAFTYTVPSEDSVVIAHFKAFESALDETFDDGTIGEIPAEWDIFSGYEATATIAGLPDESNKSFHLRDNNASAEDNVVYASKGFSAKTREFTAEWNAMSGSGSDGQYLRMLLLDGPPLADYGDKSNFIVELYLHDNHLAYRDNNNTQFNIQPINRDTWYTIKVVADPSVGTFDLYVDGEPKLEDIRLRNPLAQVDHILFGTSQLRTGDLYIDDVKVYTNTSEYELSVTANPMEGGTVIGGGSYESGSAAALEAQANSGYVFKNWTVNGIEESTETSIHYTMPAAAATITANFEKIVEPADKTALLAAIEQAQALVEENYTSASWAALSEQLVVALAAAEDEESTQDKVDEQASALQAAINALELKTVDSDPTSPVIPVMPVEKEDEIEVEVKQDNAYIRTKDGETTIEAPLDKTRGYRLQVQVGEVIVSIDQKTQEKLAQWVGDTKGAAIVVQATPQETGVKVPNTPFLRQTIAGHVYDIRIALKTADGAEMLMDEQVADGIHFTLPTKFDAVDRELLGVYYMNPETNQWEYVGGVYDADGDTAAYSLTRQGKYAVVEYDKTFDDVPSTHWAYRTIKLLSAKHLVSGVSEQSFAPSDQTTRAEFAALLVRALGLTSSGQTTGFGDVSANDWFAEEVAAAYEAGLIRGTSDNEFAPDKPITREELATLLVRAYEYKNGAASQLTGGLEGYADYAYVSSWARESVDKAIRLGLMQGKSNQALDPKSNTKRAEAVQAILNFLNNK
ncbi:S-layer homology domain-containing protein [Paenibacillus sp. PAMC21692]|uniref:S-layer homology domain-containing protein n=1 Tax=Paenibacillus sp. PAMC21692 TaxID=2762320 RepID=UPI00164E4423|nr:S-layer homology domain-containing protein [Paenibacillus sp. PAMC21692]QNK55922.1 S-layer homology domain-containing protein [Paenibacillus sp. PAMC21692]